jgi:hypothetical protein
MGRCDRTFVGNTAAARTSPGAAPDGPLVSHLISYATGTAAACGRAQLSPLWSTINPFQPAPSSPTLGLTVNPRSSLDYSRRCSRDYQRCIDMENKDADSLDIALLDWDDRLQKYSGSFRSNGVAFYVPPIRNGGSRQASGARGQVRQGAVRAQERAPNYRVVAPWSGFLIFIGAGAFVVGVPFHNEATAKPPAPRPGPIYYCATGEEMPLYEPCRDKKDQRDI